MSEDDDPVGSERRGLDMAAAIAAGDACEGCGAYPAACECEEPRDTIETPAPVCRSCGVPVLIDENEDVEASEFVCEGCADDEGDPS